jgi:glutamine amidotransferase-like uncharacterized protein
LDFYKYYAKIRLDLYSLSVEIRLDFCYLWIWFKSIWNSSPVFQENYIFASMKNICFIFLLFLSLTISAQEKTNFAIYHDYGIGAWEDGVIAFEHFLDWKGLTHERITANEINGIELKEFYDAIYFPGGDADYYTADINSLGIVHIRELVNEGGGYMGKCAGAEFACDKLVWEGITYDYPLNLFEGKAIGPIDEIAPWPDYDMTVLSMDPLNPINQFEPETEDILYWGGCWFQPYTNAQYDTLATYNAYLDRLAAINFEYGNGRVLLIEPHPEIEEDSDRDGVNVATELDDNGTDWNFLWCATDWLLGDSITQALTTNSNPIKQENMVKVFPNPSSHNIVIANPVKKANRVLFYDFTGRNIKTIFNYSGEQINIRDLIAGIYLLKVENENSVFYTKLVVTDE